MEKGGGRGNRVDRMREKVGVRLRRDDTLERLDVQRRKKKAGKKGERASPGKNLGERVFVAEKRVMAKNLGTRFLKKRMKRWPEEGGGEKKTTGKGGTMGSKKTREKRLKDDNYLRETVDE